MHKTGLNMNLVHSKSHKQLHNILKFTPERLPGPLKKLQIIAQHGEIHFIETTSPTKRESTPQTWFTS